jgi:hypothetical protein
MIVSSEEAANRLIAMAQDYAGRADKSEAEWTKGMPTMIASRAARDREPHWS